MPLVVAIIAVLAAMLLLEAGLLAEV